MVAQKIVPMVTLIQNFQTNVPTLTLPFLFCDVNVDKVHNCTNGVHLTEIFNGGLNVLILYSVCPYCLGKILQIVVAIKWRSMHFDHHTQSIL